VFRGERLQFRQDLVVPSAGQLRVELCLDGTEPVLLQAGPLPGDELEIVQIGERRAAPNRQ